MLKLDQVSIQFGGITAVNKLSLDVEENTITSIIGPNGAGKSTVFNMISRFYTPTDGNIYFYDENLLHYKSFQIIQLGIARSFQNVELFSNMTVLENLLTGLHPTLKNNIFSAILNLPSNRNVEKASRKKAFEILEMFDIEDLANENVDNLPFGYRKMVDIARAIMPNPKLLLLDEPVAGMNPSETQKISELIAKLRDDFGITILLIEHDMSLVVEISDYINVMNFGNKIAEGKPNEVINNQLVIEAYLGEVYEDAKAE